MKPILHLILAVMAIMAGVSQAAQVQVDGPVQNTTLAASTAGGTAELQVRELRAKVLGDADSSRAFDVVVLYDEHSGLYWWSYRTAHPGEPLGLARELQTASKVVLADGRIVVFSFRNPTLWVRQSSDRQVSLDQAQQATLSALGSMGPAASDGSAQPFSEVDLKGSLDAEFFYRRGTASPSPGATLSSVSRENREWRVVLSGPNSNTATLLLDDQYALLKVEGPSTTRESR